MNSTSLRQLAESLVRVRTHRFVVLPLPGLRQHAIYDRRTRTWTTLRVRPGSDRDVVAQVFFTESYAVEKLARGSDVLDRYEQIVGQGRQPLIVDCGANIGASAAYFSMCFPAARIVALEPDGANLEQARKNCRSPNVDLLGAAVASRAGRGDVVDPGWGSWSLRVKESDVGAIPMMAIDGILSSDRYQRCVPFIAKIDIEGFEDNLFSENVEWFDRFPLVMIELHDWLFPGEGRSRTFLQVAGERNRDFVQIGETVFSIANP